MGKRLGSNSSIVWAFWVALSVMVLIACAAYGVQTNEGGFGFDPTPTPTVEIQNVQLPTISND